VLCQAVYRAIFARPPKLVFRVVRPVSTGPGPGKRADTSQGGLNVVLGDTREMNLGGATLAWHN
jgi:hypothetical protein